MECFRVVVRGQQLKWLSEMAFQLTSCGLCLQKQASHCRNSPYHSTESCFRLFCLHLWQALLPQRVPQVLRWNYTIMSKMAGCSLLLLLPPPPDLRYVRRWILRSLPMMKRPAALNVFSLWWHLNLWCHDLGLKVRGSGYTLSGFMIRQLILLLWCATLPCFFQPFCANLFYTFPLSFPHLQCSAVVHMNWLHRATQKLRHRRPPHPVPRASECHRQNTRPSRSSQSRRVGLRIDL